MLNYFAHVDKAPADPILGINALFEADPRKDKINLSAGVYRNSDLKTPVLSCVKKAELLLLQEEESKNYQPIEGDTVYIKEVLKLVFGEALFESKKGFFSAVQSLGGAGALRLGGEFIRQYMETSIYISNPSWPNHRGIFEQCDLRVLEYPYYDFTKKNLAFESMIDYLSHLEPKSIVVFHVSCHNPSGADLTKDEWQRLCLVCQKKEIIPFFDAAYLGFHEKIGEDAFALRLFAEKEIPFLLSISFSKNLSLYGERIGLFAIFGSPSSSCAILSRLKILVRRNYSNPPLHGAKIVRMILQESSLRLLWDEELLQMKQRIFQMRTAFVGQLAALSHKDYYPLLDKKGLFSYCDLTEEQVERLKSEYAIYLPSDGRVNLAGLVEEKIPYVVKAIVSVGG